MLSVLIDQIPNTLDYMIAGYAVILGVALLYIASLAIRSRNLKQDLKMMEELEADEKKRGSAAIGGQQPANK